MPRQVIDAQEIYWEWEEAFDKFGFDDGNGWNGTDIVADFIQIFGYETKRQQWGLHNYFITDLLVRCGPIQISIIPEKVEVGYDNPRDWLPRRLIEDLEMKFNG